MTEAVARGRAVTDRRARVVHTVLAVVVVLSVLVLGAITDWYPYPFLDVVEIGYAPALRNLVVVAVLAVVLLLGLRLADRRLPPAP